MDRRDAIGKVLEGIGLVPTELVVDLFERALEQAGYVIVPREPREEAVNAMVDAARNFSGDSMGGPDGYYACLYRAAISAGKEGA